jgi:hypothetical protein
MQGAYSHEFFNSGKHMRKNRSTSGTGKTDKYGYRN